MRKKRTEEELHVRAARCERARFIRDKILKVSRGYIARKYGIPVSTIQTWEDIHLGGLVESGAQRLINVCKMEGVDISLEWLMYEIGESPITLSSVTTSKLSAEDIIAQELKLFHQLNKNAVHTIVKDDGLAPWLMPGDYVAGCWYFEADIKKAIGTPSIVQMPDGLLLIRVIKPADDPLYYNLTCTNPHTTVFNPIISQVKLFSAAPIVWIRKLVVKNKF